MPVVATEAVVEVEPDEHISEESDDATDDEIGETANAAAAAELNWPNSFS